MNTENQKSGKGGQRSSVWERRHPMHTDSEIIALPKFRSPTFASRYGAPIAEVIGNLSIDFGGLRIRPAWARLSCSRTWDGLVQDRGEVGGSEKPFLESPPCTCSVHKVVAGEIWSTPPTAPCFFQSPSLHHPYVSGSFTDQAW